MKNKFLSRIGQWHTPPYLRKCLTSLKALTLLLVMLLSVNVWGAEGDKHTLYDATLTWATSYNQYSNTVQRDATVGACWEYASNNAKGWAYLRMCPGKSKTNTSHIGTVAATTVKTKSIDVTIVAKASTTINSAKLYVYGGYSSTATSYANVYSTQKDVVTINTSDIKAGTLNITPSTGTSWDSGVYFVLEINLTNGNNNNGIDVSKFVVTEASGGTPSGKDVTITAESELNLTFEESDGTINVTYGEDVADKDINLYDDAECTTSFTGDWFIAELNSTTGNIDYIAEANTGAAREAYIQIYVMADDAETENTKVIKVTQAKYAAPTGTFEKFTEDLEEGDYVICSGTTALKNELASNTNYIGYETVTISADKITNPSEALVWHIAQSGDYWTLYNAVVEKYAASTGAKNKGQVIADGTDDKALWTTSTSDNTYEFVNKQNTASSVNANLRYNNGYGFACYGTGTGSALTLYKKEVPAVYSKITLATCENGSVSVTGATDLTSVASGTEITLGNAPADGYKLDAYDVYKTDDATTKVTVKDGKFKMPAYAVTVSATFSLSIETPTLSEAAGDKNDAINVKVSNYNGDYSYYYTLDGTEPTNASTLYVDADGIAINASCTLKVIAYSGDVTSPVVSATYNLPLMTMDAIFAAATAAGKTATNARVKFTDCVISGVKNNNAYLTDNAGKGLIIYASSHGFEVNDKLNGAVNVKVQLYNGSAELTELTSSTSGLTVTKDGSVSPITTIGIASLSGVNTGAVLSYENLTYDGEYFSDGTNGIKPYNNFNIEDYPTFENGDKYNVTGVYIQFNSTKEIAPRSLADLEKIEAQKYAINLATVEHGTIATDPETEAADGVKVTLSATPETGYMLSAWSVVDAESNPVEVTANQFTMPAMAVTVSATFVELPIWATTYTSNVTVGSDKVRFSEEGTQYDAKKVGSSGSAGSTTITVPAGTYAIHFHAAGWNSENVTLAVKKGEIVLGSFDIPKDAGMSNNSPFTLANDPAAEEYFMVNLSDITEETTITFVATSGKRFAIYGVNALAPAAITIDPASKDFGEAKIDGSNNPQQVFTLTPNAFATGTITAEIDGDNVFTASAVADNKVTVTFAPTEIKDDYSATLVIKHDGTQMCTATLSGKGIAATTPEIAVSDDEIDFGKVKQAATVAAQTVTVTLNYLDAATASIDDDTYFSIDKTDLVAGENTITISATASSTGVKNATITIEGTGATTKTIAVKMDVASKWAGEYTSNVEVGSDKVIISEEEYEAIKKGTSSKSESATITVPKGTQTLHFHAAAWNNENTVLVVKQGDTELGSFNLYKDAGVKSNSPFTLAGNNYDTDQYFYVNVSAYTATDAAEITFTTTASPYRFVLYGVNQEGGIVPELDHLTITGSATHTEYEVDETFDPAGLTVSAIYTLEDVEQDPIDVTEDVEWEFTPATLTAGSYDVTVKATYEDKEVSTTVAVTVTAATPEITVDATEVGFGTVLKDDVVEAKTVAVTLKAIAEATVEVSGEGKDAFNVTPTSLTESGDITITPITTAAGEFTATITISADGAEPQEVALSMIVEAPDVCDGTDDFETSENASASSYTERTTTAGWSADNAARTKIVEDIFFTINGKTSAVGVITSPELEDGIASLKIRYANTFSESNGVSFRVDIKQGENVVKAYTITKANDDVVMGTVYTETISDINVAGTYQIIITNLSPTSSSSNKDRLSIGRLCWTHYAAPEYDETVRDGVTDGTIGTMVYEHNITAIIGADIYEPNYVDGNVLEFIEVPVDETVAGLPYIFVANGENDGKVQINFGTDEPAIDCDYKNRGLVGNMGVEAIHVNDPAYAIYQNQIRPANNTKVAVGRAYIENITVLYELEPIVPAAPRRRLSLGIERSMPTGFETIMMQKGMNKVIMNNQLFIIRDGKLFNAQGALVK